MARGIDCIQRLQRIGENATNDSNAPVNVEPRPGRAKTQFADLGDRRLAYLCSGAGSPTVVLETGLGAESEEWAVVQRGLEQFTRVCRYDRAGRGDSDPAPRPRSAHHMVSDLHELLQRAAIPGPYVLAVTRSAAYLCARLPICNKPAFYMVEPKLFEMLLEQLTDLDLADLIAPRLKLKGKAIEVDIDEV